ncbi:helix-turn-helix transcriptional regulator [Bacillus thuringiensis]|uniref:helix-turn-helix domain-containing protein n=1 Tax=Bacillus thuringiensis TaxID=1428 RepID=UPI0011A1689F|nr:helix-turn-helix transcriptional regulator [Bacillus thuringiensis]
MTTVLKLNTTEKTDNELGTFLKSERNKKKLSLEKVAKAIGVSASYIHRLENGDRKNPSIAVLEQLCEFFSLNPQKVLKMAGLSKESTILVEDIKIPLSRIESIASFLLTVNLSDFAQILTLKEEVEKFQAEFNK